MQDVLEVKPSDKQVYRAIRQNSARGRRRLNRANRHLRSALAARGLVTTFFSVIACCLGIDAHAREYQPLTAKQLAQLAHTGIQKFACLRLITAECDMCLVARQRNADLDRLPGMINRQFRVLEVLPQPASHLLGNGLFRRQG